jgi:hypothetical protein
MGDDDTQCPLCQSGEAKGKEWGPGSMRIQVEEKREGGGAWHGGRLAGSDTETTVASGQWCRRAAWARAHGQERSGRLLGVVPA